MVVWVCSLVCVEMGRQDRPSNGEAAASPRGGSELSLAAEKSRVVMNVAYLYRKPTLVDECKSTQANGRTFVKELGKLAP